MEVSYLATADADGIPHIVPITFALIGDTLYWAVDQKPKKTSSLKRLDNIAANPHVALLADRYDSNWDKLWWARADGLARVVTESGERKRALDVLQRRYSQYRTTPPAGEMVAIDISKWTGWEAMT